MALKVKAVERLIKFNKNDEGTYRYVMSLDLYTSLSQDKVIKEAALRSGEGTGENTGNSSSGSGNGSGCNFLYRRSLLVLQKIEIRHLYTV